MTQAVNRVYVSGFAMPLSFAIAELRIQLRLPLRSNLAVICAAPGPWLYLVCVLRIQVLLPPTSGATAACASGEHAITRP
jgi:hypothetical protein